MVYLAPDNLNVEELSRNKRGTLLEFLLSCTWIQGVPTPYPRNDGDAFQGDDARSQFKPVGTNTKNRRYNPATTLPPADEGMPEWRKTPAEVLTDDMWNELQTPIIWTDQIVVISPEHLVNKASVQFQIAARLLATYNQAMAALPAGRPNYPTLNSGGTACSVPERYIPDLAFVHHINDINHHPGDIKFSIKWRADWSSLVLGGEDNIDLEGQPADPDIDSVPWRIKEWRKVTAQVHGYMQAHNARVGYVISDIEMQTIFREEAYEKVGPALHGDIKI